MVETEIKWSGNRLLPKATRVGYPQYSNKFKNYTYRVGIKYVGPNYIQIILNKLNYWYGLLNPIIHHKYFIDRPNYEGHRSCIGGEWITPKIVTITYGYRYRKYGLTAIKKKWHITKL